jgi:hypothetical protein
VLSIPAIGKSPGPTPVHDRQSAAAERLPGTPISRHPPAILRNASGPVGFSRRPEEKFAEDVKWITVFEH